MSDVICEEGFLVIESELGGLSGHTEFHRTREDAESHAARLVVRGRNFPLFLVSVTRFTTEEIRQIRGSSFQEILVWISARTFAAWAAGVQLGLASRDATGRSWASTAGVLGLSWPTDVFL